MDNLMQTWSQLMERILQALLSKGYTIEGGEFPTGRPDRATMALVTRTGIPVVAKFYPSGGGEIAYKIGRASCRERV